MKTSASVRFTVLATLFSLVAVHLVPATAAPASLLVTCIDLQSGKERISKNGGCRVTQEATAKWHLIQSDSPLALGSSSKSLTTCSNKESSSLSYQIIRSKCARHQVSSLYSRSTALASKPIIAQAVSYSHESSQISLAQDPATNPDAPIAYYTITSNKGNSQRVYSWRELNLVINGLQALTTYTFTVTATTADGTSSVSAESIPVTTPAYVPPAPATTTTPVLAAPAFTLSAIAETVTVNNSASGFTVASNTGGTIASFAISATPPGMSFNAATGALSGTPDTVASSTSYTITATNASGSATSSFTLTVTAVVYTVGSTGPGGGYIYYVNDSGFNCGSTYTNTGSPTGDLCHYLEVAPSGWTASEIYPWASASKNSLEVPGIINRGGAYNNIGGVGLGFMNSRLISSFDGDNIVVAATAARNYRGGGKNDWYLPTSAELNLLCQWARGIAPSVTTRCSGGTLNSATYGASSAGFFAVEYWASEADTTIPNRSAYVQTFGTPHPMFGSQFQRGKDSSVRVRPIRAF